MLFFTPIENWKFWSKNNICLNKNGFHWTVITFTTYTFSLLLDQKELMSTYIPDGKDSIVKVKYTPVEIVFLFLDVEISYLGTFILI